DRHQHLDGLVWPAETGVGPHQDHSRSDHRYCIDHLQPRRVAGLDDAGQSEHQHNRLDRWRGRQFRHQRHCARFRHGRQDRRIDAILVGANDTRDQSYQHQLGRPALRQAEQHRDRQGRRGRRHLLQRADHRDLQDRGRDLQRPQRFDRGKRRHVLGDGGLRQRHATDLGQQRCGH
ncbi:hypothetical protein chiPu_0033454, partial [Chiloscyllium punctatum]|nr:hypothetical protein [Chiloscyllium punctatum]